MMFDPTGANIDYIYKFWPDAQWSDDVQEILTKYVDAKKEAQNKRRKRKRSLHHLMILCLRPNLLIIKRDFIYQEIKKNFALLMEQGTGKTKK